MRARAGLDGAAAGHRAAAAAAAGVWEELLQQNWRVELDAGLGTAGAQREALLLVAGPAAAQQLLAVAAGQGGAVPVAALPAAGSVSVLWVDGTQAGDPLDWRSLGKRLLLAGVEPGSAVAGDSILAVVAGGAAAVH